MDAPRGYELLGVVGRGASESVVYLARQSSLNRLVALKHLPSLGVAPGHVEMFRREAMSIGALRNPHIVSAFDFAADANGLWLAIQLVRGPDLGQLVKALPRVSPGLALQWILDVGAALSAAHQAGIVHRDVKPANVLIGLDGRARLTDFGIAQIGNPSGHSSAVVAGTPAYMAPEQVLGRADLVDARTDLYSLGTMAYQLLVGHHPLRVERRDQDSMMDAQVRLPAADPVSFGVSLPRRLRKALLQPLEKERDRRPRSVALWSGDLQRAARRAPADWHSYQVPTQLIYAMDPVAPT